MNSLYCRKKSIEENQIAIEKLNSKQTSRLFFSLFAQLLGILGVCLYVTYKYAWPYVEKKVYELPYDDRAKALALQAFDSAFKYAVAKITFQETRDELRKKLPPWLGGREDEKKGEEEEKKEEEVTHPWWWLLWPPNCWKNKKEKEKKRKEDEEKKKKKEEEKKRKEEEEEKKRKGEKKEYSSWLWCLWPGYWWWLLKNSWSRKDGQKEEVQEK
jgi:hypothetical protein